MSLRKKLGVGIVALGLAGLVGCNSSTKKNIPNEEPKVYCETATGELRDIKLNQNSFGVNQYVVDIVVESSGPYNVHRSSTGSEVPDIQEGYKVCFTVNPDDSERKKGVEWSLFSYNPK